MNQVYISPTKDEEYQKNQQIYTVTFEGADKHLAILRSDYFSIVHVKLSENIEDKHLKFMMNLSRILKKNGTVQVINEKQSNQAKKFAVLAKKLGFYEISQSTKKVSVFSKIKPENQKNGEQKLQLQKLSIGFKSQADNEQIDEEELMQNQGISLKKDKIESCAQKPRACANCNCGRKDGEQQPQVSKEQLVSSVNEGKPVSGCGKCYLGDSFRCGSCPYKGMPAFKPGDKLKMVDEGQVVVQSGEVRVQGGKVKIQI